MTATNETETKHTPGPWHISFDAKEGWRSGIEPEDGGCIAEVFHVPPDDKSPSLMKAPEGIANARLIAAAPELLELVRIALENIESKGDDRSMHEQSLMHQLRAAIAKATGISSVRS